ncbi:MAG: lipid A export permease/ATP-binding protein MsbA [Candidatus Obscuribacterales bacterium]|nr:lipid A export permease/ATP-binding protein MsbA [Steroidobacteraceae bacterium]
MKNSAKPEITVSQLQTYKRLVGYLRYYKGWFALGTFGAVIYAAATGLITLLTKQFFDGSFIQNDRRMLAWAPVGVVLIFILRGIGEFTQAYFMGQVSRRVVKQMRKEVFDSYLRLPISYYDRTSSADLLSRLLFNTEQVAQASTESITVLIKESLTIIFIAGFLFAMNAQLTLIALCVAPPIAFLITRVNRYFKRYSQRIMGSMVDITRVAKEAIEAPRVIRVFNAQDYERAQFEAVNEHNRRSVMKLIFTRGVSNPLVQVIAATGLSVVLYMATAQALAKTLTVGDFISVIGGLLMLMQPVKTLVNVFGPLQQGIVAGETIFNILDEPSEPEAGNRTTQRVRGDVEYRAASFQYQSSPTPAVQDITVKIAPGEVVAFVGRSGSGKSTLVNLLPRFYDVTAGAVLIDGHDVRDYTLASLRDQIALVSQDVVLFNDTIRANIAFGREVSDDAIERAAITAHVMEFVKDKPEGLLTEIGDRGVMLSGGQRQRISIARALLKDAPILILDEATSALDTESERVIQSELEELMKNRTTLVIAHRLSTIERADRIVVMNGGRIEEVGAHAELLAKNGQYAALHRMQFNE